MTDEELIQHAELRQIVSDGGEQIAALLRQRRSIQKDRDNLRELLLRIREAAWSFAEEPMDRKTYTLDHAKRKRLLDVLSSTKLTSAATTESKSDEPQ